MIRLMSLALIFCATMLNAQNWPVHTFSIVERDSVTGELCVAVQSHWFSVGPLVPWAEAGIGAVATQSFVDPSYGPLGLEMMRAGKTVKQALAGLLASDPHWVELTLRLPKVDLLKVDDEGLQKILNAARKK